MKRLYETPECEVVWENLYDIVTLSTTGDEDDEIGGGGNPWAQ